ncbi:hypothetical protein BWQ96_00367 [Gracilariopsis chorda]|uniref:Uncharacterized protein n=1 Tax=Gracilariopsis chorda TaxID=448386 RepID=A0A2V3J5M9_9FLOR|nr:hypothetical protein BWQ96_00367 [Gracilariopsis chorda]|eukprot:PXF49715.1 hypothetical protein BWQ96_00367 [Gracilariopsis chorda]
MDKLTGMLGKAVGGDPGEGLEQTMKEKAVEELIQDKVEDIAGEKVAHSEHVENIAEKIADAIGDKVPTSMLGASAMAGMKSDDKKEGASSLMDQASSLLGGSDKKEETTSGLMEQASSLLGGKDEKKDDGAADLLGQAASFLGKQ